MTASAELRSRVMAALHDQRDALAALCALLGRQDSQNPPGDTASIAAVCLEALAGVPGVEAEYVTKRPPIVNVVARVTGASPGRRLILNGHLDIAQRAAGKGAS